MDMFYFQVVITWKLWQYFADEAGDKGKLSIEVINLNFRENIFKDTCDRSSEFM